MYVYPFNRINELLEREKNAKQNNLPFAGKEELNLLTNRRYDKLLNIEPMYFGTWAKTKELGVMEDFTIQRGKRALNRLTKLDDGKTRIVFAACKQNEHGKEAYVIIGENRMLCEITANTHFDDFHHQWLPSLLFWFQLETKVRAGINVPFAKELLEFFNK